LKRVLILLEGPTEEGFVKRVLQPYLWNTGLSLEPKIVTTKLVIGAASHKGGGDFQKILADVRRLLNDSNAVAVTTLFDFYGFPNIPEASPQDFQTPESLETCISRAIQNQRFKPYLQRHEFEAFLFVSPETTARVALKPEKRGAIEQQAAGFQSVEEINNGPDTSPSKRLRAALGSYGKPLLGAVVTEQVGVESLRQAAPRFNEWLRWIEGLSAVKAVP
jgi:Domain of unknown function (DUF4276)